MKLALVFALLFTSASFASEKLNTYVGKSHTCLELKEKVASEGAIIVNNWVFTTKIVSNLSYCENDYDYRLQPTYLRSSDKRFCYVGYTCDKKRRNNGRD